jgi:hypothetical protein
MVLVLAPTASAQISPWVVTSILTESAGGKNYRSIVGMFEDPVSK